VVQLRVVLLVQVDDLLVGVLLHLPPRLLDLAHQLVLLLLQVLHVHPLLLQLVLVVVRQLLHQPLVPVHQLGVLLVPLLVQLLLLPLHLLMRLDLGHDFGLVPARPPVLVRILQQARAQRPAADIAAGVSPVVVQMWQR
jgi:hypothetical protein